MVKEHKGKYRLVVSLSEEEYRLLRKLAFEMEVTVNECLRLCAVEAAREKEMDG